MDRHREAFEAAERARLAGDHREAAMHYGEAARQLEESPAADLVELHLGWGMALLDLDPGLAFEGRAHLLEARRHGPNRLQTAVIEREVGRFFMLKQDTLSAKAHIGRALGFAGGDLAERGACLGYRARIMMAQGGVSEALELFGTADVLLQRSANRHYELDNLSHFLHFLVEFRLGDEIDDAESNFSQVQAIRLVVLVDKYGGPTQKQCASDLLSDIFADIEG